MACKLVFLFFNSLKHFKKFWKSVLQVDFNFNEYCYWKKSLKSDKSVIYRRNKAKTSWKWPVNVFLGFNPPITSRKILKKGTIGRFRLILHKKRYNAIYEWLNEEMGRKMGENGLKKEFFEFLTPYYLTKNSETVNW